jgi:transcriptional regulator with XRE-family HTH domain
MANFGDVLRSERKKAKKTLSEVAAVAGCKISFASDVELGRRKPFKTPQILKIAELLKCDSEPLILAAALERDGITINSANPQVAEVAAGLARSAERIDSDALDEIAKILRKYEERE